MIFLHLAALPLLLHDEPAQGEHRQTSPPALLPILGPIGHLKRAPLAVRWIPSPGAEWVRVRLERTDQRPLVDRTAVAEDGVLVLTPAERRSVGQAGEATLWLVAGDREGRLVAASGVLSLRIPAE